MSGPRIGQKVVVWYGEFPPSRLQGEVEEVVVPGEALSVRVTDIGSLDSAYSWLVGEVKEMWRLDALENAKYDTFFWSP